MIQTATREEITRYRSPIDTPYLAEKLLHIDNKEGIIVPFKFNRGQLYFSRNKSHRNIILKHRQGGWSSSILADMYLRCITIPHTQAVVISHEGRATQRLLDRVQFYHDTMQPPKPKLGAESRNEKSFPELHSSIYIGLAGSRAVGRGDTIRYALLSELAYYEDARNVLNGIEDAVPMTGELTIESTPCSEDNILYEEWVKAREGKSPYKPFFFPWWWTEDYRIPRGSDLALPEDRGDLHYTTEEEELISKFRLTEDQIRWRRWKLAEKQGLFYQEYPEDEITCFVSIGDPVFDPIRINDLSSECYDGIKCSEGWTMWIPPEPNMRYIIGADTSAGAPGGSYSAACVLNSRWEVCATYQSRVEPHVFAQTLKKLGILYNNACLAIERNFTGYAVIGHLADYPNIYYQKDFLSGKITSNKGWWTNEQTRQYMITATKDMLKSIRIFDLNLVRQLRSYRYIRYKATPQSFDDLAMAFMIAVAVKKNTGTSVGYLGNTPGWNW